MSQSILTVEGVAKSFDGFAAVSDVSFTVDAGERVALIGPNGAGKSTTFNMINGQLRPDRGRVLLDGRDVTGLPPRALWRLGVGRTFQITAVFASMSVAENVAVALLSRERSWLSPRRPRVLVGGNARDLLAEVGLQEAAEKLAGVLAYGDLKRLELALALANEPRLLLLDEPTAGMAPKERRELMALIVRLAAERRTAVLFTEHDMDVVFGYATRILVMNRGEIIAAGSPAEVRADQHVRDVYLGHGGAGGGKPSTPTRSTV
jgi:branched-chain amino acid transport system ATP-binding protein